MKTRHFISIILICILVITAVTFFGNDREQPATGSNTEPGYYELILENDTLKFYSVSKNKNTLLDSVVINRDIFPKDDIEMLEQRVKVSSYEKGVSIIEDFSS